MTGRIEKSVFISYRRIISPPTMQPKFSSPQKRNHPHALSRMGAPQGCFAKGQTVPLINRHNQAMH